MAKEEQAKEKHQFLATNQLNRGARLITDETEKLELIELNQFIQVKIGDFNPNKLSSQCGKPPPPNTMWTTHHDLSQKIAPEISQSLQELDIPFYWRFGAVRRFSTYTIF